MSSEAGEPPGPTRRTRGGQRAKRACATAVVLLLAAHAAIAWAAVRGKSATADEPAHLGAAVGQVQLFDFRVDREHPPLWKFWAGLPLLARPAEVDPLDRRWREMPGNPGLQFPWSTDLLYRRPANDGDRILARSRAMMLAWSVALGALVSGWAWRLGGGGGAVVAAALYAFDPNFLAHGPLVKNDVAFALGWTAVAYTLWRLGRRLSARRVFAAAGAFGLLALVKFSAALALPVAALLLGVRAAMPVRWDFQQRGRERATRRLGVAAGVLVTFLLAGFLFTWAGYGFRYFLSVKHHDQMNWRDLMWRSQVREAERQNPGQRVSPEVVLQTEPVPVATALREMDKLRLMPEAWSNGLLFTYISAASRRNYLLGAFSDVGWWYYFPFTMLVKTPIATLASFAIVLVVLTVGATRSWSTAGRGGADVTVVAGRRAGWMSAWAVACLAIPPATYLAFAMSANVNLGVRHVLAAYPALFVAAGWVAGTAVRRRGRRHSRTTPTLAVVALVLAGLVVESAAAFPNYIPFFNAAVGTDPRTKLHLLSDSNLDWGQDLPALKRWRDAHPGGTLYLAYFGFSDPAYYQIEYVSLPGTSVAYGQTDLPSPDAAAAPGYIAISATVLQGANIPDHPDRYRAFRDRAPDWVLGGGSIFIYRVR